MVRVISNLPHLGEIYLCDYSGKSKFVRDGIRPVMVIQNERINASSPSVLIAAVSSVNNRSNLSYHVRLPELDFLPERSVVLLDEQQIIPRSKLGSFCGRVVDPLTRRKIREGMVELFNLRLNPASEHKDLICLCAKCVSFYYEQIDYSVTKLTPPDGFTSTCDKCGRQGAIDYLVSKIEYPPQKRKKRRKKRKTRRGGL